MGGARDSYEAITNEGENKSNITRIAKDLAKTILRSALAFGINPAKVRESNK